MNALSLYDEEEIIEEEVEQKPAKTEQEPAKPKKRFFGSKEPAAAAPAEEPKRERKSILNFKGKKAQEFAEKMQLKVNPESLVEFGLIPEFIGRLPVVCTLEELNKEALMKILKEPKNSLVKQFVKIFAIEKVNLQITDNAIEQISKELKNQIFERNEKMEMTPIQFLENIYTKAISRLNIEKNDNINLHQYS